MLAARYKELAENKVYPQRLKPASASGDSKESDDNTAKLQHVGSNNHVYAVQAAHASHPWMIAASEGAVVALERVQGQG